MKDIKFVSTNISVSFLRPLSKYLRVLSSFITFQREQGKYELDTGKYLSRKANSEGICTDLLQSYAVEIKPFIQIYLNLFAFENNALKICLVKPSSLLILLL